MSRPNVLRVAAACVVVGACAFAPVTIRAKTSPPAPRAAATYVRIPIYAPDAGAASSSPAESVHRPTTAPATARTSKSVRAPTQASPDAGIRTTHADAFGDPFASADFTAPSGPCARASTCKDYALRLARWPRDKSGTTVINWKFNDFGRRAVRAPAGLLESAVGSAMREWSRWDSNVVFRYAGTTTASFGATGKDGSCADGTNVVTWDKLDPAIIAVAGVCTDRTGKTVRDADLAMNVTYHWENIQGEPQTRHSMDITSIVTHELGHWLGLLDLYGGNDVHQTMSGYSEYGETRKRTPALGDALGIQAMWPCGSGDSCPRTGIVDD